MRAVLESDNTLFDENEMVFGKIAPGRVEELRPLGQDPGLDVHAHRRAQGDALVAARDDEGERRRRCSSTSRARPRPLFAYTYQTIDDQKGSNHDGQVQRGEQVRLLVTVKNLGQGRALHTEAVLRNGMGQEGIMISAGRFDAKDLGPGETKTFSFVYEVGPEFKGDEYQLELAVGDTVLGESVTDKIKIKVAPPGPGARGRHRHGDDRARRRSRCARRPATARSSWAARAKGTTFKVSGKLGAFTRLDLDNNRSAFVATADVTSGGAVHGALVPAWQVTPPVLTVVAPTVATGDTVHLKGHVSDDHLVRDIYVRVWNRNAKIPVKKVFYQPNRHLGRPDEDGLRRRHPAVARQQPRPGVRARVQRRPVAADGRRAQARGRQPRRRSPRAVRGARACPPR